MRQTFSTSLILALLAVSAQSRAADFPAAKAAPVAGPPAFTWTGLYLGFNFSAQWSGSRALDTTSVNVLDASLLDWGRASALGASGSAASRLGGFLNGGQLGYNWQIDDRVVVGLEADIQGAGVRGGKSFQTIVPYPLAPGAVTTVALDRSLEYLGTARGRIGYTIAPNLLAYATGGLAYGGVNAGSVTTQTIAPSLLVSPKAKGNIFQNQIGWTVGAGLEWAFARSLSAKLEYLYYDLGAMTLTNEQMSPLVYRNILTERVPVMNAASASTRFNGHILRAGLNYRFDWSEPPTAGSGATPLFASPRFADLSTAGFGDWRFTVMPYFWGANLNGAVTVKNQTVDTNVSLIDLLTRSSSVPLAFMGRAEARNGPFALYGDLAWMQLRFADSTLRLRSPLAGLALGLSAGGRMKLTLAIGEAGGSYEIARFAQNGDAGRFTAVDAYAGLRYWHVNADVSMQALAILDAPALNLVPNGAFYAADTGGVQWIDPVVGVRVRHQLGPGENFDMRGDIGGFGAGSKFSWQFFGGYSHDFNVSGVNFAGLVGYRALSVDYSRVLNNKTDALNLLIHGPVIGLAVPF